MTAITAVLCDLDDTLYPQADWLAGAWTAVADAAAEHGVPREPFLAALHEIAAAGSARGGIIDRALGRVLELSPDPTLVPKHSLAAVDAADVPVPELVAVFQSYRAPHLDLYPGALRALAALRERVPIAIITDGDPGVQEGKLISLGLLDAVDEVIISDRFGREFRKPHPEPFRRALAAFGAAPERAVCIGDRPDKDIAGATAFGIRAIRVRTGEYADVPDTVEPWFTCSTFAEAAQLVLKALDGEG